MKLYLMRHGLAMEREEAFLKRIHDSQRPLVDKGKDRSRKMAKFLKEQEEDFEMLLFSPLLRSKQTADVVREIFPGKKSAEVAELVPDAPPEAFARWLQKSLPQATKVLAIGHEPQMSSFASWALNGATESFLELKKSGVIALELESFSEIEPGSALLKWVIQPKQI